MIALIQRVQRAHVEVAAATIGEIERGLLALIGVERFDEEPQVERLLDRILGFRVFPDTAGRMNRSVTDIGGGLLLVPQFTLVADTRKGMRPSFSSAAKPRQGEKLFRILVKKAEQQHSSVASGRFGADMQVHLVNDGPVTFWLQVNSSNQE